MSGDLRSIQKETANLEAGLFKKLSSADAAPNVAASLRQQRTAPTPPPAIEDDLEEVAAKTVVLASAEQEEKKLSFGEDEVLHASNLYQKDNLMAIAESIKSLTYTGNKKFIRWIRHNSKEMVRVTESVDQLVFALKGTYDLGSEDANVNFIVKHFQEVVNSCDDYIGSHSPKTKEGKLRLELVRKMRDEAAQQQESFRDNFIYLIHRYQDDPQRLAAITPMQVFSLNRTASFSRETPGVKISSISGGTSTVRVVTQNDRKLFFKEREVTAEPTNESMKARIIQVYNDIEKRMADPDYEEGTLEAHNDRLIMDFIGVLLKQPLPANFSRLVEGVTGTLNIDTTIDLLGFPIGIYKELREFTGHKKGVDSAALVHFMQDLAKYATAGIASKDVTRIDEGSELSCRNVATTRIADLLGISDIVARSEMANVTIDGEELHGIVMEEAKGVKMSELANEHQGKTFHYSPLALKQLSILQLFDVLCGQTDRHMGNYYVQFTADDTSVTVTSIKAIDNDLSFGRLPYEALKKQPVGFKIGRLNCGETMDDQGKTTTIIPSIDADFAQKLEALTDDHLRYFLADILSEQEINSAIDRLSGIKAFLARAAKEDNSFNTSVMVQDDAAWADRVSKTEKLSDEQKAQLCRTNYALIDLMGKPLIPLPE